VRDAARARTRDYLHGQGLGRHANSEIAWLADRSLASLSTTLGDKPYLTGETICGADATLFAMIAGIVTPQFESAVRDAALGHRNLVAHSTRMMDAFYPGFAAQQAAA